MSQTSADIDRELEIARKRRTEFVARVKAEERHAASDPAGYRRKVYGMVALAYGYVGAILIVALAALGGLVYLMVEVRRGNSALVRIALYVGLFVLVILRSLWIKLSPPSGVTLKRGDARELYKEIDAIAERLKAPKPNEIRVDYRLNAAASQTPRWGMFGPSRNVLLLGLPLLTTMSPEEVRAIIAHEFGHFSGSHGKFGAWAYRVEWTWRALATQLRGRAALGSWLFSGFASWFQPRFSATTFVLRRAHEYEADKAAAEIAGASTIARALMRMKFLGPKLSQTFWKGLAAKQKELPNPPPHLFAALPDVNQASFPEEDVRKHVQRALADKTDYDDTHPCLTDRLKSLGQMPPSVDEVLPELMEPIRVSAAEAFLGGRLPRLFDQVSDYYLKQHSDQWGKKYSTHQKNLANLDRLRKRADEMPLTEEERVDMAYYTFQVEGSETVEPLLRSLHEELPNNPRVTFWLGLVLAEKEDMEAEPLLRRTVVEYPQGATQAMQFLAHLYRAHGREEDLGRAREESRDIRQSHAMLSVHGRTLKISDDFEAHRLSVDKVEDLVGQLRGVPGLSKAYLVRKILPNGERRLILVAFYFQKVIDKGNEAANLQAAIINSVSFPERVTVFSPRAEQKAWLRRLGGIPGSLVLAVGDK
ncbi:MAG TPA: M48 family metallopeptidase [Fimbriimonadaceae bacterium]|nr:M48 family metallopeptidase [Fimbriimonadaceae bacterium]